MTRRVSHVAPANRPAGKVGRQAQDSGVFPLPCTGGRVRRLSRRVTSFYELYLREIGIKLPQYSVLANLSDQPQSLLQLADRLELDRTTLTRNLRILAANGWVAEIKGDDARQRLLILTPAGMRFRKQAHQVWKTAQLALEQQLGRAFVAELHERLEQALSQLKPALPEEN